MWDEPLVVANTEGRRPLPLRKGEMASIQPRDRLAALESISELIGVYEQAHRTYSAAKDYRKAEQMTAVIEKLEKARRVIEHCMRNHRMRAPDPEKRR